MGKIMKQYKYFLNQRPAMPGALPSDFIRLDDNDKGGRYGAVYYGRELNEDEIKKYELKAKTGCSCKL